MTPISTPYRYALHTSYKARRTKTSRTRLCAQNQKTSVQFPLPFLWVRCSIMFWLQCTGGAEDQSTHTVLQCGLLLPGVEGPLCLHSTSNLNSNSHHCNRYDDNKHYIKYIIRVRKMNFCVPQGLLISTIPLTYDIRIRAHSRCVLSLRFLPGRRNRVKQLPCNQTTDRWTSAFCVCVCSGSEGVRYLQR